MASEAQIAANRRNAEKSTGPRTEQGKAKVAGNPLRHGLRAQTLTAFDERDGDFVAFHEAQRAAFEPVGDVEEQLVERIALCACACGGSVALRPKCSPPSATRTRNSMTPKWRRSSMWRRTK
jgi:hypothetical protein